MASSRPSYAVHVLRDVAETPSGIIALAASTFEPPTIALSREHGAVETWVLSDGGWTSRALIPGRADAEVRALAWLGARLYGATVSGALLGLDLERMAVAPRSVADSTGGAVWCLEPRPDTRGGTGTPHAYEPGTPLLAIGCEDGVLRLLEPSRVAGREGGLDQMRAVPVATNGAMVLSCAWATSPGGATDVWAGCDDGVVVGVQLTPAGHSRTVSLALEQSARCWAVRALPDGQVATGDSLGHVQFWDGAFGTLTQSFARHDAAVLALAASADGTRVFASGVDARVVCFQRAPVGDAAAAGAADNDADDADADTDASAAVTASEEWQYACAHRPHSLDVRALVLCGDGQGGEALVSGGLDTKLCVCDARDFRACRPRRVAPYTSAPTASLAPGARALAVLRRTHVNVWRLGDGAWRADGAAADARAGAVLAEPEPRLALELRPSGLRNLACVAMAHAGDRIACSDASAGTRLYAVKGLGAGGEGGEGAASAVRVRRLRCAAAEAPAHRLAFAPDGARLVAATVGGAVNLVGFAADGAAFLEREIDDGPSACYALAVSHDSKWAAVARGTGTLAAHRLDKAAAPVVPDASPYGGRPVALAFGDGGALVVAFSNGKLAIFDLSGGGGPAMWTRDVGARVPPPPLGALASADPPTGICMHAGAPNRALVHGHRYLCNIDFQQPVPDACCETSARGWNAVAEGSQAPPGAAALSPKKKKKRKLAEAKLEATDPNFALSYDYKPVLFAGMVSPHEMVVVESPWLKVVQKLRDPMHRDRFGT